MAIPESDRQGFRPSDIAGRGFPLAKKGYDPEEVHEFLREVAEYVSRLQGEVEWLRARSDHLERRSAAAQEAAYARLSRDFMDVVRRADQAAGRVRLHAEAKAQSDVMMSRKEAERVLNEARIEAERILSAARLEAHDIDWQSKGPDVRRPRESEPDDSAELSIVDLPTVSMDIGEIWEHEDSSAWSDRRPDPPQLFEDAPASARIQDVWTGNGNLTFRSMPEPPKPSSEPEDLGLSLDVSILDLFEDSDD